MSCIHFSYGPKPTSVVITQPPGGKNSFQVSEMFSSQAPEKNTGNVRAQHWPESVSQSYASQSYSYQSHGQATHNPSLAKQYAPDSRDVYKGQNVQPHISDNTRQERGGVARFVGSSMLVAGLDPNRGNASYSSNMEPNNTLYTNGLHTNGHSSVVVSQPPGGRSSIQLG